MARRGFAAASACLALCGCGAYDLAGMPRVVANGGFAENPATKAAAREIRAENQRREQELAGLAAQQDRQAVLARDLAGQRSGVQERIADLRQQRSLPGLTAEQQRMLDDELAALAVRLADIERDEDEHRRRRRLTSEQESELRGVRSADEGQDSPPPLLADAPTDGLESFRTRFVRHAIVAQSNGATDGDIDRMLQSGFLLIQSNCDDFFARMAIVQRDADIGRDMIAPIIALLTGIVALRNIEQEDSDRLLDYFNLASSTALAGISIVDRHFLFESENIVAVRDLTFEGFEEMEEGIEAQGPISFEGAARRLIDYQLVCTPAAILRMTREAIAGGEVERDSNAPPSADDQVRGALAAELGHQGRMTDRQTLVLWKLYMGEVSADDIPEPLVTAVNDAGLGSLVTPEQPGPPVAKAQLSASGIAHRAEVRRILLTLSRAAQTHYADTSLSAAARAAERSGGLRSGRDVDSPPATGRRAGRRVRLRVQ